MRSPVKVTLSAAGISPWIPIEYTQIAFAVGLFASVSEDVSTPSYFVEITPDQPNQGRLVQQQNPPPTSLTRSAAVASVIFPVPHGLSTGDTITVVNSGDPNLDGTYTISSTPTNASLTYTVANTGLTVALPGVQAWGCRVFPGPAALTTATTRQSAPLNTPCMGVRLRVASIAAGSVSLAVVQGLARG